MHAAEQPQTQHTDPFAQLGTQCAQCIDLAQRIRAELQTGKATCDLTPLLRQSAAEVTQLQEGIRALATQPPAEGHGDLSQLIAQMRTLLELEDGNQKLLASKGIPINRPRPYQYGARRAARS